ncbi:Protein of unknown function [Hymenobacter arizonensis]|uniref:DUF2809 domain-containing protein n=1 Tax=Hymenobacter arizonensis TaxID=1227077 RepID=A0A1I5SKY1_HYMAR|nr:Protein of unknown function [Hymenobacter arizonensis]
MHRARAQAPLNKTTSKLRFNSKYFCLAIVVFLIEVIIALYVHDQIIRPYVGDFLVVLLLYCLVRGIFSIRVLPAALLVLLFSYLVEGLQYFNLLQHLGLQHSRLARTVLGISFSWADMAIYTAGFFSILAVESLLLKTSKHQRPSIAAPKANN